MAVLRKFHLNRTVDVSGVSGTGIVMESVELFDGRLVSSWRGEYASQTLHSSLYAADFIHGHEGNSEFLEIKDEHQYPILFYMVHSQNTQHTRVGKVADIGVFSNGKCFLSWRVSPFQIEYFDNIEHLKSVHCKNGYTHLLSEFDSTPKTTTPDINEQSTSTAIPTPSPYD